MQDDSLTSVFSLSLTYKVILQEVNLSPGDKALLWLLSGLPLLPLAFSSSCSRFLGEFYFLGLHGFNSRIAIEMSTLLLPDRPGKLLIHCLNTHFEVIYVCIKYKQNTDGIQG